MNLGTDAQEKPGTRAGVFLREDRFDLITAVLGSATDEARCRLLGINRKTVWRARRGQVGEEFIARVLVVMQENEEKLHELNLGTAFEDVFRVDAKPVAS